MDVWDQMILQAGDEAESANDSEGDAPSPQVGLFAFDLHSEEDNEQALQQEELLAQPAGGFSEVFQRVSLLCVCVHELLLSTMAVMMDVRLQYMGILA